MWCGMVYTNIELKSGSSSMSVDTTNMWYKPMSYGTEPPELFRYKHDGCLHPYVARLAPLHSTLWHVDG